MRVSTSAKASQFFQFTALWIYLPCSIQEKQKKLQKLVLTRFALVIKNSPGSAAYHLDCFKATEMQLQLFYDIPVCHKPFQGVWCLKTWWETYSLWARAHNRICEDSRDCSDGAAGGESCPGSSEWKSFLEGAHISLQPETWGRNCARSFWGLCLVLKKETILLEAGPCWQNVTKNKGKWMWGRNQAV